MIFEGTRSAGLSVSEESDGRDTLALTLEEFTQFLDEIREQPAWRSKADREMDYCDGNQLDSEILAKMEELGIPPAIEPLMGPIFDGVLGLEIRSRGDWNVTPDAKDWSDEIADAMNFKLHQAEAQSGADKACSDAFDPQIKVGIGWVLVAREEDPFKYPYVVEAVHRNEIFFDWFAKSDLSDARYLIRRKWFDKRIPALMFPDKAELIGMAASGWQGLDAQNMTLDGEEDPGLFVAADQERGWSIGQQEWRDEGRHRVCLFEVWYRRWERALVLRSPDGRIVEYDKGNAAHVIAVASGAVKPESAIVSRVRISWWMGPHKLDDKASPYRHNKFPYVPFFGKREDRTNVPYGLARGMIYLQDQINALHSKSQWLLAAKRIVRTEGAVKGPDELFRQEAARPDADIKLDAKAMRDGGIFRVEQDLQLTAQQFQRLEDSRAGLRRVGGIYSEFEGSSTSAQSGVQFNAQVDQSNQALADIMDNYKSARAAVGDLLLSLIISDMIGKPEEVEIAGNGLQEGRTIRLNVPVVDNETGYRYLDNDIERAKLKVGISNIPSSVTFKQQQLAALSEAARTMPAQYQAIILPYMLSLMDVPERESLIRDIRAASQAITPEQVDQQIKQGVDQALTKYKSDLAAERIRQNQPLIDAQVRKALAEAANKGVEGVFSATEAAKNIALAPGLAPSADQILHSSGAIDYDLPPIIADPPRQAFVPAVQTNTNPLTPINPGEGMAAGIEGGQ